MTGQIQGVRGQKGDKGDPGVGIASTVLNADYTLTITLTDGTSYTTPPIRGEKGDKGTKGDDGKQGIQGVQGVPGETGNGIASIQKTGTQGLVDTYTITFTNGTTTTFQVTNGQNGAGSVADVWQNGVSVLDGDTAKVVVPTKITDLTDDSDFVSEDIIADEYSPSSAYAVGDYCIYDGQFYRCTTAISTAEAWTAAHWTMATVGEELTDLKGDIPQNVSDLTNDAGYQTASQVTTAVATKQDTLVSGTNIKTINNTPILGSGNIEIQVSDPTLAGRVTALETEQTVLDARMDTFASLTDGSTTGDAELTDIRVGANGVTYPSAGDAVREQFEDVDRDIKNITEGRFPLSLVPNEYINRTTGSFAPYNTWSRSSFIYVKDVASVEINWSAGSGYNGWYDANFNFISNISAGTGRTVVSVPYNAVYMAFSNLTTAMESADIKVVSYKNGTLSASIDVTGLIIEAREWPTYAYIKFDSLTLYIKNEAVKTFVYNDIIRSDDNPDSPLWVRTSYLYTANTLFVGKDGSRNQTLAIRETDGNYEILYISVAALLPTDIVLACAVYDDEDQTGLVTLKGLLVEFWLPNSTLLAAGNATENMSLDFAYIAGDLIPVSSGNTANEGLKTLDYVMRDTNNGSNRLVTVKGNHDENGSSTAQRQEAGWTVFGDQFYRYVQSNMNYKLDITWGSKPDNYFYIDFPEQKIRIICLNTSDFGKQIVTDGGVEYLKYDTLNVCGIRQEQAEWLANTAMMLQADKSDWHVAIFCHVAFAAGIGNNDPRVQNESVIDAIVKAFVAGSNVSATYTDATYDGLFTTNVQTNFASQGAKPFIGCFCGHTHDDQMSTNVYTTVTEICALGYNAGGRDNYTKNEVSFDIVTIDTTNRTVWLDRVGFGTSRSFTY